MSAPTLKLKRGLETNLPTLSIGEPGFTTDSYKLFIGSDDGNKQIGGGAQATTISVGSTDANSAHFLTFVVDNNTNPTQESLRTDAGITYNPSSNLITVSGEISVTTLDIGGTNVTST